MLYLIHFLIILCILCFTGSVVWYCKQGRGSSSSHNSSSHNSSSHKPSNSLPFHSSSHKSCNSLPFHSSSSHKSCHNSLPFNSSSHKFFNNQPFLSSCHCSLSGTLLRCSPSLSPYEPAYLFSGL